MSVIKYIDIGSESHVSVAGFLKALALLLTSHTGTIIVLSFILPHVRKAFVSGASVT